VTPWVLEQVSHSTGIPAPTKEENEGVSSSAHNRATFQGEGERVLAGVGGPSDFVVEGVAVENDTAIAGERVRKFAGNAFQQNSEYLTGGYFAGNVGRCFYKCGKIKVGDHKSKSNVRVKILEPGSHLRTRARCGRSSFPLCGEIDRGESCIGWSSPAMFINR
jgi:hypothetical protein